MDVAYTFDNDSYYNLLEKLYLNNGFTLCAYHIVYMVDMLGTLVARANLYLL